MRKLLFAGVAGLALLTSCGEEKWTSDQKAQFLEDCTNEARSPEMRPMQEKMCNCMLEKIMAKYPTYKKANDELNKPENNAIMESITDECVNAVLDTVKN